MRENIDTEMKNRIVLTALALAGLVQPHQDLKADEGMWMIQDINSALEKKMQERGLKLSAGEIYNADAPGAAVADAVVSLGFSCSGSIISDKGLLITNHHCAYSDIFSLSTPEHNYLADGYWAVREDQELPVPGKQVFFLKRVLDVTSEVENLKKELDIEGKMFGMRKLSYTIEKKYKDETGLEAYLSSMWSGKKYYISLYEMYTDIRLVAAPPVSVASFGGDEDNWEWPQQKCDFAMYRVYTAPDGRPADYSPENIPLKPVKKLEISREGYKPGDYTMVIGYPGRTSRYSSSMETDYQQRVILPITNELHHTQMSIMKGWMESDPEVWLKYSDIFFSLSNLTEMQEGQEDCIRRFNVVATKIQEEKELQNWIEMSPVRTAKWGGLLDEMRSLYARTEYVERNKAFFRETLFRGTIIGRTIMRMSNSRAGFEQKKEYLEKGLAETDPRVEKELLGYAVSQYFSNVDSSFFGPYQKELMSMFGTDYAAMTDYIWEGTCASSVQKAAELTDESQFEADRLRRFIMDVGMVKFNRTDGNMDDRLKILSDDKEYIHALYEMRMEKGLEQYPDANSTMRITYGTVGPLEPRDGVICSWQSSTTGIIEKYDSTKRDFCPSDDFMSMLKAAGKMPVNFLTDNDITGGNSGSPVLDARGRLIGLAFDGNKESLACDISYTEGYNKCICVDIRYILWTLEHYGHMNRIIGEL